MVPLPDLQSCEQSLLLGRFRPSWINEHLPALGTSQHSAVSLMVFPYMSTCIALTPIIINIDDRPILHRIGKLQIHEFLVLTKNVSFRSAPIYKPFIEHSVRYPFFKCPELCSLPVCLGDLWLRPIPRQPAIDQIEEKRRISKGVSDIGEQIVRDEEPCPCDILTSRVNNIGLLNSQA